MKLQIMSVMLFALAVCAESQYIDGSYIILMKDGSSEAHIEEVIQKIEGHVMSSREEMEITSSSSVLPIVFGKFDKETAEMVSGLESVKFVEQDQVVTLQMPHERSEQIDESDLVYNFTEGSDLDWKYKVPLRYNLDILDNDKCLDNYYHSISTGLGVDVYILDTGLNYFHKDIRLRAFYGGYDIEPANGGWDQQGHGTHCAGIAGGTYSGVAKLAALYSIRVLNSEGYGSNFGVLKGMIHAYERHLTRVGHFGYKGAVMSMSLADVYSQLGNDFVNAIVEKGVTIVTASANDGKYACDYSPGSAGLAINVGAHGYSPKLCLKPVAAWSNYGKCVDIVAPGVDVLSADYKEIDEYIKYSGTSMACPHVSGVVATMLSVKKLSPEEIKYKIQSCAINDLSDRMDHTRRLYVTDCLIK